MKNNLQSRNLLLQVCCVGCGVYILDLLKKEFNEIVLFFYNPNIWTKEEYQKRLSDTKRVAREYGLKIVIGDFDHNQWLESVKGYETEPEKGERCTICYYNRLREAVQYAQENNFQYFGTSLTTSPHKDAQRISKIGQELAKEFNVKYLDRDFKKQDGFKKSCEMSKKLNLYRQNYCGCEFSLR